MASNSRDQAVQLLNNAKLASEPSEKVEMLKGLREIIVRKDPSLLPEFLPEVVELQVDPSPLVRTELAQLLGEAAAAAPRAPVLHPAAAALAALAADAAPTVAKKAVSVATGVFRVCFAVVALQGLRVEHGTELAQQLAALWAATTQLRATVLALLQCGRPGEAQGVAPAAVRIMSANFTAEATLALSSGQKPPPPPGATSIAGPPGPMPANHPLLQPRQLASDADAGATAVAALLRPPASEQLPGALRVVVAKAVGRLAQERPRMAGRVLPPLLALAKHSALQLQDGGGSSATVSTARAVAEALRDTARLAAPEAAAWRPKLLEALHGLAASGVKIAADAVRELAPPAPKRKPAADQGGAATKRVKVEAPPANGHPAVLPMQQQPAQQQAPVQATYPPPVTPAVANARLAAGHLLAQGDGAALAALVESLSVDVFADMVIAIFERLPSRDSIPDDTPANGGGSGGGLASMLQGLQQRPGSGQAASAAGGGSAQSSASAEVKQEPPQSSTSQQRPSSGDGGRQHLDPQSHPQQQQQSLLPRAADQIGAQRGAPPAAALEAPKPPAVTMPKFELRPAKLPRAERAAIREAAVKRVLAALDGGPWQQELATALLTHIVSEDPEADGAAAAVLKFLLADSGRPGTLDFALDWLHSLFVAHCLPPSAAHSPSLPPSDDSMPGSPTAAVPHPSTVSAAASEAPNRADTKDDYTKPMVDTGSTAASGIKSEPLEESPTGQSAVGVKCEHEGGPAAVSGTEAGTAQGADEATAMDVGGSSPAQQQQQLAVTQAGGSVGPGGQAALPPVKSAYESVLMQLLEGLRDGRSAEDGTLPRVLREAPLLPAPAVPSFLAATIARGDGWITAGLTAAHHIILLRPPDRAPVLEVVLEGAAAADLAVQRKAVALVKNMLFMSTHHTDAVTARVEAFATAQLNQLRSRAASTATPAAALPSPTAPDAPAPDSAPTAAAGGSTSAPAGARDAPTPEQVAEAGRRCALYCALCTKRHALLRGLMQAFAAAPPAGKAAILQHAPGLAKTIGGQRPALPDLIRSPPPGSQKMLWRMMAALTDTPVAAAEPGKPQRPSVPAPLVAAALAAHQATGDVRWAVPVLAGVDARRAAELLPPAAALCDPAAGGKATFEVAVKRLLMRRADHGGRPQMTPVQLLVHLHSITPSPTGVPIKALMAALAAVLAMRAAFPAQALAAAMKQLVERHPLPPLFMRFLMQVGAQWPQLARWKLEILDTLISKQVWQDAAQWRGWQLAAEGAGAAAYPHLLRLPPSVLAGALASMPSGAALRPKLAAYAADPSCRIAVSIDTLQVLQS